MGYRLPSSGPISFGTTAGSDRSINALIKSSLSSFGYSSMDTLCGATTYLSGSIFHSMPLLTGGSPHKMSELYLAGFSNKYLSIKCRMVIDGIDRYSWDAKYNCLSVTHIEFGNPTVPIIDWRTYNDFGTLSSGTLTGIAVGVTALPFTIPITENAQMIASTGRMIKSVQQYPSASNGVNHGVNDGTNPWVMKIYLNDDAPDGAAGYSFTLLYTYPN